MELPGPRAPTTPLLRRTTDNPGGLDPALIDANYAAVAANVPKWCADFEAAGPYFGTSPGASQGLVDWTIRMIVDTPLTVYPGAGHGLYASDHEAINADLLAFITGHRPQPARRGAGPNGFSGEA